MNDFCQLTRQLGLNKKINKIICSDVIVKTWNNCAYYYIDVLEPQTHCINKHPNNWQAYIKSGQITDEYLYDTKTHKMKDFFVSVKEADDYAKKHFQIRK